MKYFAMKKVKKDGLTLKTLTKYQGYRDIALAAIAQNAEALFFVDESLLTNEFYFAAIKANPKVLSLIQEHDLWNDNAFAFEVLRSIAGTGNINNIPDTVRNNKEFFRYAVKQDRADIYSMFASDELKEDKAFFLELAKSCKGKMPFTTLRIPHKLSYANDTAYLLELIKIDGDALKITTYFQDDDVVKAIRKNKEIVKAAILNSVNGEAIQFASEELQRDLELKNLVKYKKSVDDGLVITDKGELIKRIKTNGVVCLNFISEDLKKEIANSLDVLFAIANSHYGVSELGNIPKGIFNEDNKDLYLDLIYNVSPNQLVIKTKKANGEVETVYENCSYMQLKERKASGEEVSIGIAPGQPRVMKFIQKKFLSDPEFMLKAVKIDGRTLGYCDKKIINKELVLEAVKSYGSAIRYISKTEHPEIFDDYEIIKLAVADEPLALKLASPGLRDNEEIVLESFRQDGKNLQYASPRLQNTMDIVKAAIDGDALAYKFAGKTIADNPQLLRYAYDTLQKEKQQAEAIEAQYQQNGDRRNEVEKMTAQKEKFERLQLLYEISQKLKNKGISQPGE